MIRSAVGFSGGPSPEREFQSDRHRFRVSTVQENVENLHAIYQLIRKYRPDAKVILTLSPVPLAATFRDMSCITANQISKAILRAALDQFFSGIKDEGKAFYWPSYEIAQTFPGDIWTEELRHIKREVLDYIMTLFETLCCSSTNPCMILCKARIRARDFPFGLFAVTPAIIRVSVAVTGIQMRNLS